MDSDSVNKEQLLTPEEAADFLAVHRETLRRYSNQGLIVFSKTSGGHRRYRISDLLDYQKSSGKVQADEKRFKQLLQDKLGYTPTQAIFLLEQKLEQDYQLIDFSNKVLGTWVGNYGVLVSATANDEIWFITSMGEAILIRSKKDLDAIIQDQKQGNKISYFILLITSILIFLIGGVILFSNISQAVNGGFKPASVVGVIIIFSMAIWMYKMSNKFVSGKRYLSS